MGCGFVVVGNCGDKGFNGEDNKSIGTGEDSDENFYLHGHGDGGLCLGLAMIRETT